MLPSESTPTKPSAYAHARGGNRCLPVSWLEWWSVLSQQAFPRARAHASVSWNPPAAPGVPGRPLTPPLRPPGPSLPAPFLFQDRYY